MNFLFGQPKVSTGGLTYDPTSESRWAKVPSLIQNILGKVELMREANFKKTLLQNLLSGKKNPIPTYGEHPKSILGKLVGIFNPNSSPINAPLSDALKYAESLKKKNTSPYEQAKTGIGVMGGVISPKELSQSTRAKLAPLLLGNAEGGQVLTPPGAVYNNGQIMSNGQQIGSYLPGYEPTAETSAIPAILRNKLGITQKQAVRNFYGVSKRKKITQGGNNLINEITKGNKVSSIKSQGYIVGKIYMDTKGRRAKYLGNGKWELQ